MEAAMLIQIQAYIIDKLNAKLTMLRIYHDYVGIANSGEIYGLVRIHTTQIDHALKLKQRKRYVLSQQAFLSTHIHTDKQKISSSN